MDDMGRWVGWVGGWKLGLVHLARFPVGLLGFGVLENELDMVFGMGMKSVVNERH